MAVPTVPKVLQDGVQMSWVDPNKPDKTEAKLVSFTSTQLLIRNSRIPTKIEQTVHFLQISSIESKSSNQICLTVDNRPLLLKASSYDGIDRPIIDEIISHIALSLKHYFPESELSAFIKTMALSPQDRLTALEEAVKAESSVEREAGPCGGFSTMYRCMCDLHKLPFRDEVVWDVDTIYLSQSCRELSLNDFDHLEGRDLVPIISALRYNTWFTKLNATDTKLVGEALNEILQVVKLNKVLEELLISNIGAKFEFANRLAASLTSNKESSLQVLDISNNVIDDRGVGSLALTFSKLPRGLTKLDVSNCSLSAKGVSRLAESLQCNQVMTSSLTELNLSGNCLKGDEIATLYSLLAQPNSIKDLNLSDADLALDMVSGALQRGCTGALVTLNLSGNTFSVRKNTKEVIVPPSWEQFFGSVLYLTDVKLSNCRLPTEALKSLFSGLASNANLLSVSLDLSGNEMKSSGSIVLQSALPHMVNITTLDISDNELDLVIVNTALAQNKSITNLSIGKNFSTVKARHLSEVLEGVVQVIQDEHCKITSLSVAGSKLKNDIGVLINALGSNNTLLHLDITGNSMGDYGARMLAKALQINTKLQSVYCDSNGVTARGFNDIAAALESNYTLRHLPAPVNDAAKVNCDTRAVQALQKIEAMLHRNHSPRKFNHDRSFRLQHGFLISTTQQMMDRKIGHIKKIADQLSDDPNSEKLLKTAKKYTKDAHRSQTLLMQLKEVSLEAEEADGPIQTKLSQIADDLSNTVAKQQEKILEELMETALHEVRHISKDLNLEPELRQGSEDRRALPPGFIRDLVTEQVGADVYNKLSEINLSVSAYISDKMVDAVLESLASCHRSLADALNAKISRENADQIRRDRSDSVLDTRDNRSEKRDSLSKRKCRPQSLMDDTPPPEKPLDKLLLHTKSSPNIISGKLSAPKNNKKAILDEVDDPAVDTDGKPNRMPRSGTAPQICISNESLDHVVADLPSQPLQHLNKSRPRPQQRRAMATRPSAKVAMETSETDEGMDAFFRPTVAMTRDLDSSSTSSAASSPPSHPKSKKPTPGKMFSKFLGKDADEKSDSKPEKTSPFKTGLASGIGNFLQKKKSAEPEKHKPEPEPAPVEKAPEPEPEPEPEPVVRPKRPMGVPMMGGPMGGANLLADLKQKQARRTTMLKTPEKDLTDGSTKESPKEESPALRPSPGSRPGSGRYSGADRPSPAPKPKPGAKPAVSPKTNRRDTTGSRDSAASVESASSAGSRGSGPLLTPEAATVAPPVTIVAPASESREMTPPRAPPSPDNRKEKSSSLPVEGTGPPAVSPKPRVRSMLHAKSPTSDSLLGELASKQRSKSHPDDHTNSNLTSSTVVSSATITMETTSTVKSPPVATATMVAKDTESSGSSDFEMVHAADVANNNDEAAKDSQTCAPKATMDEDDDDEDDIIEV